MTVNSGGGGGRGSYSAGLCLLSEGFLFFGRLWFISLTALCSAQQYQTFMICGIRYTWEARKLPTLSIIMIYKNVLGNASHDHDRTTYEDVWLQQWRAACNQTPEALRWTWQWSTLSQLNEVLSNSIQVRRTCPRARRRSRLPCPNDGR